MKKHAKYAASSAHRWMQCPASLKLAEGITPPPEGRAAQEGTKAHFLMEYALNTNIKSVIEHFKSTRDGESYPHEMRFHVEKFVAFVRGEVKPNFELMVEQRVDLKILHPTEAFGTVDVAVVEPYGTLHVIDFKYGRGHVDEVDNPQMLFYALGIADLLNYDLDVIKTTIYQPRGEKKNVRTFKFSLDYLLPWRDKFKRAIASCETATVNDVSPGDHCKFCIAINVCPAFKNDKRSRAERAFTAE